jgi:hypothetical protein
MGRKLLIVSNASTSVLEEVLAPDEQTLHDRMRESPGLIPIEDFDLEGPVLVVGQEVSLASGRIDLVCLTRGGELLLVEFKTGPQNPDFRHALAQVVDYGSDLWEMSVDAFENSVVRRYLTGPYCTDPAIKGAVTLDDAITRAWQDDDLDVSRLRARLAEVLIKGDFHFVVVAQRFTPAMEQTVRYLNATMNRGRFYLVELIRYHISSDDSSYSAFAGQVVASPPRTTFGGPPSVDETRFLAALADDGYRLTLERLFDACKANGLRFAWGAKGASIRMPAPDHPEPLSIAWIFPSGGPYWGGISDLGLGVDQESLRLRPSVAESVKSYAAKALQIDGAKPVVHKGMTAATFEPEVVIAREREITDLIARLVSRASGQADDDEPD